MKTQAVALFAFLFCLTATQARTVEGNGKVITKEISVKGYDNIELSGNIQFSKGIFNNQKPPHFQYTQGKDTPLKVTIDENLFPLLVITCEGNSLSIKTENNTQIKPTQYVIAGGSKELRKLKVSGSMDFIGQNSIQEERMDIKVSGSCDVIFEHPVLLKNGEFSVSGSGDIKFSNLACDELKCQVSGSGDINLKGKADQADYSVSGSGDITAFDFAPKNLRCSVSGSGDAKVYATNRMDLSVSGSGDISYKGPATIHQSKSGNGDIHKAN